MSSFAILEKNDRPIGGPCGKPAIYVGRIAGLMDVDAPFCDDCRYLPSVDNEKAFLREYYTTDMPQAGAACQVSWWKQDCQAREAKAGRVSGITVSKKGRYKKNQEA